MGQALTLPVTLTSVDCGECGGTYAINERYRQQCAERGRSWTCPYCKTGWGYQEGDLDRVKKELAAAKEAQRLAEEVSRRNLARANEESAARERAEKAATRLKKRAAAGLCPCCNRTFVDLQRHMASKHKEAT